MDAVEFYTAWLTELKARILEDREAALDKPTASAFVTFKRRWTQVVATTALHSRDEEVWVTRAAPAADELLWHKLSMRLWERKARFAAVWAACIIGLLFFTIPVSALQAILQIKYLESVCMTSRLSSCLSYRYQYANVISTWLGGPSA